MKQKWYLFFVFLVSCVSVLAQNDKPLWSIEDQDLASIADKDNKVVNRENVFHLPADAEEVKATFLFHLRMNRPAGKGESADRPQVIWYGRSGATATSFVPTYTAVAGKDSLWAVSATVDLSISQMPKDADVTFALGLSANSLEYSMRDALRIWSLPEAPGISPAAYTTFTNMPYSFEVRDNSLRAEFTPSYRVNNVLVSNKVYSGTTASDIGDKGSQEEALSLSYSYSFGNKVWKEGQIENAATLTTIHRPVYSCSIRVNGQTVQGTETTVTHSDDVVLVVEHQNYGYGNVFTSTWSGESSFIAQNFSDANRNVTAQATMSNQIAAGLEDIQPIDFQITVLPEIKTDLTIPAETYTFIPDGDTKVAIKKVHNQDDLIWNFDWSLDGVSLSGATDSSEQNEIVLGSDNLKTPGTHTLRAAVTCYKDKNRNKKYIDSGITEYKIRVLENPEVIRFGDLDDQNNSITCDGQEFNVNIVTTGGYDAGYHFDLKATDDGTYGSSEKTGNASYRIKYSNPTSSVVTSDLVFEGYDEIPANVSTTGEKQTRDVIGNNKAFHATIYPHPAVRFSETLNNYFYGSSLTQSVDTIYTMPSNWTFEWFLDGLRISGEKIKGKYGYEDVVADGTDDSSVGHTIHVYAVNRFNGREWANTEITFPYTAWHRGALNGIRLTHENSQNQNIYEGHDFVMDALSQYGYPDGWEYTWTRIESDEVLSTVKSDVFKAYFTGSEGSQVQTYKLIVKNSIPGLGEDPFAAEATQEILVWKKAVNYDANADASIISITDNGNGAAIGNRISEGRKLTLSVPQAQYGYNNNWTYAWNVSGENSPEIQIEIPQIQIGSESMLKESRTLSLGITNMGPNGVAWENNSLAKTYTVYKKPRVPERLVKKGNGNTRTLVATMAIGDQQLMDNEYYLCFGYRAENGTVSLIGEPQRQQGPGQTRFMAEVPQSQWGSDTGLCAFALWHYDDGVWISSELRFLNGDIDDQWDGSDYTGGGTYNGTRGGDATSIQENVFHSQDVQSAYGLGGTVRGTLQRGINIVRMSDGSVRKIIKK